MNCGEEGRLHQRRGYYPSIDRVDLLERGVDEGIEDDVCYGKSHGRLISPTQYSRSNDG